MRIAVVFTINGEVRVVRGLGNRLHDDSLGDVLRIELDSEPHHGDGASALIIRDDQWNGEFSPDTTYGCDYLLNLPLTA